MSNEQNNTWKKFRSFLKSKVKPDVNPFLQWEMKNTNMFLQNKHTNSKLK